MLTDNYIQDITNTQNYNQYGYVYNNPLLYIDPSGNASQGGGKDCIDCGLTDSEQTWIGNGIKTIADNWDNWGIKDWAKKNLNIKNWGKSISKWFGGGGSSGPPPNRSSYVSLNNANYGKDAFAKRFHGIDPYAKPKMNMESINALLKDVDGLNNLYQKSKYKIEISTRKDSGLRGYTINGKYFFYDNAFTSNYKLASTMFHEFYHGFQDVFMGGLAYRLAAQEGGFGYINGDPDLPLGGERYIERTAYEFEWSLGNHSTYVSEGINKYKKL